MFQELKDSGHVSDKVVKSFDSLKKIIEGLHKGKPDLEKLSESERKLFADKIAKKIAIVSNGIINEAKKYMKEHGANYFLVSEEDDSL